MIDWDGCWEEIVYSWAGLFCISMSFLKECCPLRGLILLF